MKLILTDEEKRAGELVKATTVAIYDFLARHPSAVSQPDSLERDADEIRSYPMLSMRHVHAMRSEFEATVREIRRQVSLGYWSQANYDRLTSELLKKGLIDITQWRDVDAARVKEILEKGEIRKTAEFRLMSEYLDTVSDEELRAKIDALLKAYELSRHVTNKISASEAGRKKKPTGASGLSQQELDFIEKVRRSAIASLEYAAMYGEDRGRGKPSIGNRLEAWRSTEVKTRRDLKDMERAFWAILSKVRRDYLTEAEYKKLAGKLTHDGLIDISQGQDL